MRKPLAALAAALLSLTAGAVPALSADYVVTRQKTQTTAYAHPGSATSTLPACDDARVLAQVEDQFEYGAPRVLNVALEIYEFRGMNERAYQPETEDSPIERRYCQAQATISDNRIRPIFYVIEYPMGLAAAGKYLPLVKGWRAEGCVLGLDEWHVYGAECQSLRRFQPSMYVTK